MAGPPTRPSAARTKLRTMQSESATIRRYGEDRLGNEGGAIGGGATHAWAQIYLTGAGWVEFDPTNKLIGGRNLIRVAVTRDPKQAIPLGGTFTGAATDFLGMNTQVEITADANSQEN